MTKGPSPHLSWDELACHDAARTPYPGKWRAVRAVALAEAFEAIREMWGLPLIVRSAYRTPEYNAAVGGAAASEHMQGRALDLAPPRGVGVYEFWDRILDLTKRTPIRGVGYASPSAGNFVHIDIRPSLTVATWRY